MSDSQARYDGLIAKLRDRRCRLTPQRLAVLHVLASSLDHPSAVTLYDRVKSQFPTMSLATVYKTLDLLKSMDEVLELGFSDDTNRYDGRHPWPHPHLICVRCHKIVDPDLNLTDTLAREAAQQSGYKILGHRFDIYGLCPDCQREQ
jgi:Fur family transcriptional regulator, peroxide stress response regulator